MNHTHLKPSEGPVNAAVAAAMVRRGPLFGRSLFLKELDPRVNCSVERHVSESRLISSSSPMNTFQSQAAMHCKTVSERTKSADILQWNAVP